MAESAAAQILATAPTPFPALDPATPLLPGQPGAAAIDPAKAPTADPKVSQSLQILIQREKRALESERRAKAMQTEYESKQSAFLAREAKMKEFDDLWDQNPLKAIEFKGKSYKDLTDIAINDGAVPVDQELKKLKEEIQAFKKSQEDGERQKAEDQKRQAAANEAKVLEDFKGQIKTLINENPKDYELIAFDGQENMVYEVIDEMYNRSVDPETGIGKVMPIKDAADKVEKWLRETKYAKATELEFFKSKLVPPKPKPEVQQELTFRPQQHRTLTNQLSATPAKPRNPIITDEQRIARAIAYAKGLRP